MIMADETAHRTSSTSTDAASPSGAARAASPASSGSAAIAPTCCGTKAEALDGWAAAQGRAFLRHDYSGHGESGGDFRDGTISRWLEREPGRLPRLHEGPQVLVGSSMGAWIALRMVEELRKPGEGERIAGLVLIAPAPGLHHRTDRAGS